jgi:von Willebrand factor type A domain
MEADNQILGYMDPLFRISSTSTHDRIDVKSIVHDIVINNYFSTINTNLIYEVQTNIESANFSLPKSKDSTIENLQFQVCSPGQQVQQNSTKLKAKKLEEVKDILKNSKSKDLLVGIASEDVHNSSILSFNLGALKLGETVSIALKLIFDTSIVYSADRTLYFVQLPRGLSILYNKGTSCLSSNTKLIALYERLKSATKLNSLIINLDGVPNAQNVTVNGHMCGKTSSLSHAGIENKQLNTSFQQGIQLSLKQPTYSDWENFRIDVSVPLVSGEDRSKHQEKIFFYNTIEPVDKNSPLPVTSILSVRHNTPFSADLQKDLQNQIKLRDPEIPQIEVFKKYVSSRIKYDVIFVVDQSSSMNDDCKHDMAISGVKLSLQSLPMKDCRFNIYTFASNHKKHYPKMQPANEGSIAAAVQLVEGFKSSGSTNLLSAMQDIFNTPLEPDRKRVIVLLSDGDLTDHQDETIQLMVSQLSANPNLILCGLCVGNNGPRDLFEKLTPYTNGGLIDYPKTLDPLSESFIAVLKSTFWPTYRLCNFEIIGAKVAYLQPADSTVLAAMGEAANFSFLLTDVGSQVTIKYDATFGGKIEGKFTHTIQTVSKQYSEAESLMKLEAQKLVNAISVQEERSQAGTGHDPVKNNKLNQNLPLINRPTKLSFEQDLIRLGLRFNLLTPYTCLQVEFSGSKKGFSYSERYEPVLMYTKTTSSFLSATRNSSIIKDFREIKQGSSVQQEFEQMLLDEVIFPDFKESGKLVWSENAAQKFLALRLIKPERAFNLRQITDQETKDYNFTKYVIIMILQNQPVRPQMAILISKACTYLEECIAKGIHKHPTKNPFAKVGSGGGGGSGVGSTFM